MRVLMIGGTGFVGGHTVACLARAGHRVAVFHRGGTPGEWVSEVLHIQGDRKELPAFVSAFREFGPEVVLDTVAYLEREARLLVQVFRGLAGRVVVLSSQDVYRAYGRFRRTEPGPVEATPYREESPLREQLYPYRAHAKSPDDELLYEYEKILVEQAVSGDGTLPATILRLPLVYGPGDPQCRLWEYLGRMEDGQNAIALAADKASWRWTRGYVENVAAAIARAVVDPRATGRVYNLGEEPLLEAEWVRAIGDAAGWAGRVVHVAHDWAPLHLSEPYDYCHDLVADVGRVREELGHIDTIPRDEGLRRTVRWQRSHPPEHRPVWHYPADDSTLPLA
jgi:nucleoside-diphosphate-sugar epimerase